jgi:allantoicase
MQGSPTVDQLLAAEWTEILPQSPLVGDSLNKLAIEPQRPATHLRFKIYPDGGVARLRAHGEVAAALPYSGEIDLAAIENGGLVVAASDMFFGSRQNLIMPGRSRDMSDGWETRRRRGPGHDWVVIRLGANGVVQRAEVDTSYFKGNYPDRCALETCDADGAPREILLSQTKLQAHTRHTFRDELRLTASASYVRFSIFPDGGVSRLRLFGRRAAPHISETALLACCGSRAWVKKMAESQPFATADQMFEAADHIWWTLAPDDWREAFAAHPEIGERNSDERASREQSGMNEAAADVRDRIAAGNRTYLDRFGHIYIVCASGKSAGQMAEILESRLLNDPATELRTAAAEQRQIIRLRLEKWLDDRR